MFFNNDNGQTRNYNLKTFQMEVSGISQTTVNNLRLTFYNWKCIEHAHVFGKQQQANYWKVWSKHSSRQYNLAKLGKKVTGFTPLVFDLDLVLLRLEIDDFSIVCFLQYPTTTSKTVGRSFIIVNRRFLHKKIKQYNKID